MKLLLQKFIITFLCFSLIGCQDFSQVDRARKQNKIGDHKRQDRWFANTDDVIDPYNALGRRDYMQIGENKYEADLFEKKLKLPQIQNLIQDPEDNFLEEDRIVSISVNEDVPLKEVLVELARRAEVDVEIDKNINDSIIFIAKERPFSEVIKRISKIANLRYSFEDDILRIEKDNPFIVGYKFNILDITRSSSSSVSSALSVGGGSGDASSASIESGSSSKLDIKSGDGDIWKTVEDGVGKILTSFNSSSGNVSAEGSSGNQPNESALLSVNKNAGIVSVLATSKQHEAIKQYLDSVHISLTSQVLIEAKVLEVTLDDQYSSGIDWSIISEDIAAASSLGASPAAEILTGSNPFKIGVLPTSLFGNDNTSITASVELLETFGVTRSLSNPRISTMNNQFAVLNFSQNEVYFDVTLEREEQDATDNSAAQDTITVESEIKTVPIGIVLTLQPSIDLERDEITMSVRPTLTRVTDRVSNPGVTIIAQDLGIDTTTLNADIPVVEVRELDTVLRAGNGEIMVIGGLLEERTINTDRGVPGLSRIPYLGNAFKSVSKDTDMIETVIFMKSTIVPGQGVSIEDQDFYKKFNKSRVPFTVD